MKILLVLFPNGLLEDGYGVEHFLFQFEDYIKYFEIPLYLETREVKTIIDIGEARFINEKGEWIIENDWMSWKDKTILCEMEVESKLIIIMNKTAETSPCLIIHNIKIKN